MEPPSVNAWEHPAPSRTRPRPSKKLWVIRVLGLLLVASFSVLGAVYTKSMDVPWDGPSGNERFGLFGNRGVVHWVCDEGHDHYSAPFWSAALLCAVPTALFWFVWPRRRQRKT